jgi:hypothetical protein
MTVTIEPVVTQVLARMREDGHVLLERFVDAAILQDLYIAYQKRINAPVAYSGRVGRSVDKPNVAYVDFPLTLHANAVRLAVCEPLVELVERYLETPVVLSHCTAYRTHVIDEAGFRKALRKPGEFSGWHSDANLLAANRGYRCAVAMVYLNDVRRGTGGVELVRGSHRYGGQKRAWSEAEILASGGEIVEVCAAAGSVIVFDMESIHRAGIPRERPRDIIRYMYVPEGGYTEPLVFSNSTLPRDLAPETARLLRLGRPSTVDLPVSDGVPGRPAERRLAAWLKARLRPALLRTGYYR